LKHPAVVFLALAIVASAWQAQGAEPKQRYAVFLSQPSVVARYSIRAQRAATGANYRDYIRREQATVSSAIKQRGLRITGSAQTVLNAVFVEATPSEAKELNGLPGVMGVAKLHRFKPVLNKAVTLENVPAAWTALGGTGSAGAGVKVAIIDSGIDQNHAAFQDSSLQIPAGFPKCDNQADCGFTNNKVIVARSYVENLANGSLTGGDTRPDDLTARDHIGHGTALGSVVAGVTNTGPAVTITGIAPKAFLGNYKVFGSSGLNDFTGGDVLISAIDDAVADGMDIAVLSLSGPAVYGPLETGPACGNNAGVPCDPEAFAVEQAVTRGNMLVVAAAGNDGDSSVPVTPALATVGSPATAPSALAVGASTNSHVFVNQVRVLGSDVPSNLQVIPAVFGDGPLATPPLTAPLFDVSTLDGTGYGCTSLPLNALAGTIAIVLRTPSGTTGGCNFADKVLDAQFAGAVGVIIMLQAGVDELSILPGGLSGTSIPAVLIANTAGTALKTYLAAHPGAEATMDATTLAEAGVSTFNQMASFSSRGPSIDYLFKPEMVAVGTQVYMATQEFDSNGIMWDPSGYIAADGTSFSTPMVAGAAALVKQAHPGFTALQIKAALVGTATQDVTEGGSPAVPTAMGNGKLSVADAIAAVVLADPPAVSFGSLAQAGALPEPVTLDVHYAGTGPATLNLTITGVLPPTLDRNTLTFTGPGDQTVTLALTGTVPAPGIYSGALTIQGAGPTIRVPYFYVIGDGVAQNVNPISTGFDAPAGQPLPGGFLLRVVDQYGVGAPNVPVTFSVGASGGSIQAADRQTDANGFAGASVTLGPSPGRQSFSVSVIGMRLSLSGIARAVPTINPLGVVNSASFQAAPGIVPGSYFSLFGAALADVTGNAFAVPLPPAISETSVAFEVPGTNPLVSLPGAMLYVAPAQVNVQVPWELEGQTSVQIRSDVGATTGAVYTAPVVEFAPGIYMNLDGTAAALDLNQNLITSANPIPRGQSVELFCNGLGRVDHTPPTGQPAPLSPLANTLTMPTVTVGGQDATVQFSGLAPGFPGLYQVNFIVPQSAPTGLEPVVLTIGGVSSPPVSIWVQ
jgi:minor extracellular serine protease Vpr